MIQFGYTLKEISEDIAISVRELRKFVNKGELNATKIGRAYSVTPSDLDEFLNQQFNSRNYLCPRYIECLETSKKENTPDCANCPAFADSDEWFEENYIRWNLGGERFHSIH